MMPLVKGKGRKSISRNIRTEMAAGKKRKQSVAIALSKSRESVARPAVTSLLEFVAGEQPSAVDRDQGIIRGVKILGKHSKNGRVYSDQAMRDAAGLYEGAQVCIDHPNKDAPEEDRPISSVFGKLQDIKLTENGAYGDLHYVKSHPQAEPICEMCERMPGNFGLSHNAEGQVKESENGPDVVERVENLRSVDVVSKPATNTSIYERERAMPAAATETPVLERLKALEMAVKPLIEVAPLIKTRGDIERSEGSLATDGELPTNDEVGRQQAGTETDTGLLEDDAEGGGIGQAFKQIKMAIHDCGSDTPSKVKALQAVMELEDEINGLLGGTETEDSETEDSATEESYEDEMPESDAEDTEEEKKKATESARLKKLAAANRLSESWRPNKKSKLAEQVRNLSRREQARSVLESHGVSVTTARANTLADLKDKAVRKSMIESWKEEDRANRIRQPRSQSVHESQAAREVDFSSMETAMKIFG